MTVQIFTTGRMGSGKDEFAKYLEYHRNHSFIRVAFADGIRRMIKRYSPDYVMKSDRALEIDVGNTMRRWFGDNVWIEEALRDAADQYWSDGYYGKGETVISDGRFPMEYEECVVKGGFTHVHIDADEEIRLQRLMDRDGNVKDEHFYSADDCQIPVTESTIVLSNNGTLDEFHQQIDTLIERLQMEGAVE